MSLNKREINQLVCVARDAVNLIDATTIVIGNLTTNLTRNQLAVLVNRWFNETEEVGSPPALSES